MSEIVIKPAEGTPEEAEHFAELMRISAPEFFPDLLGKKFKKFFVRAFLEKGNLFSHKHVVFAKFGGRIAGMLLSYDWKAKNEEKGNTGWLMMKILGFDFLRQLPAFISSISGSGRLEKGGYYISNIAVYPDFRGHYKNKLVMPPGNISVSYVIERNPSSATLGTEVESNPPSPPQQGVQQETNTKWLFYAIPILAILIAGGYLLIKKQPSESSTSSFSLPLNREEFQKKIEEMDLSRDEMRVLLYLYDRGGKAPQAEMKKMLNIPKTTAWRMFKRLEERGLIRIYKKRRENWVELLF